MRDTQRAWAEIDLDSITHNIKKIKEHLNPDTKLMGVVKANAYGHGAVEIARTLVESGVDMLSVAFVDEAIQLRRHNINLPILILGKTSAALAGEILENDIIAGVADVDFAKSLSDKAVSLEKTAKIHIKIDTGMTRIGFVYDDNIIDRKKTIESIKHIWDLPNIEVEGIFTHFAMSDSEDDSYTKMQFARFMDLNEKLLENNIRIPIRHVANSAAISKFSEMQLDMVRAGIIMYGLKPSEHVDFEGLGLIPAMTFKTRIMHLKDVDSDVCVSYGGTYKTDKRQKIATLGVGYADGYSRLLSGKAEVIVGGKKVNQIGRICMDQCMIDVTEVNNINVGDEVILFGNGISADVSADSIAEKLGTINYEIVCMIGRRVPRIYIKSGEKIKNHNYLLCENDL